MRKPVSREEAARITEAWKKEASSRKGDIEKEKDLGTEIRGDADLSIRIKTFD